MGLGVLILFVDASLMADGVGCSVGVGDSVDGVFVTFVSRVNLLRAGFSARSGRVC